MISEEPETVEFSYTEGEKDVYCFEITDVSSIWKFCDEDHDTLWRFRNGIKERIISKVNDDNNEENPNYLVDSAVLISSDKNFNWEHQQDWANECKTGKYQSPISINTVASKSTEQFVSMDYDFTDATVEYVNDEATVFGDFGRFTHSTANGPVDYYAHKIVFKFPQEHYVDGLVHAGEM